MLERIREKLHPTIKMYPENRESLRLLPKEFLTPIVVKYINEAIAAGGAIVTLRKGSEYLSLAIMKYIGKSLSLQYVMTANAHRHKGYAYQLLAQLLAVTDRSKGISTSVNTQSEDYAYMKKILTKLRFQVVGHYSTYIIKTDSILSGEGHKRREQVKRFYDTIIGSGYQCVSFEEADEALLEQIRNSAHNDFKNTLDPNELFNIPNYILKDYSFLLAKNGTVIAYTILSVNGRDVVAFDHIAACEKYRNMGFVLAPVLRSLDKLLENKDVHYIIYQIFDYNTNCKMLMENILSCDKRAIEVDFFQYKGN